MHSNHQAKPLPSRVYERYGVRVYSTGYKRPGGSWAFRLSCDIADQQEIAALREEATYRTTEDQQDCLHSKTFTAVAKQRLNWHTNLPQQLRRKAGR